MTVSAGDLYVDEHIEGEVPNVSRTDQFAPSLSTPGTYEFASQLPEQPEPDRQNRARGVALGSAAGEPEMYLGQGGFAKAFLSTPGVNVFSVGSCAKLECATAQAFWTGAQAPAPFAGPEGVAVDPSTSSGDWASGDVFVTDSGVIDIFEPQAGGAEKYVGQVAGPSPGQLFVESGAGIVMAVSGLNGDLVVGNGNSTYVLRPEEEGAEKRYGLVCQLVPPEGPVQASSIAVDDSTAGTFAGEIYVGGTGGVYEFGPECAFRGSIAGVPKEGTPGGVKGQTEEVPFVELLSLAVDPVAHKVFVGTHVSGGHGAVDVFGPDLVIPDVATHAPSNLTLESDPETGAKSWSIEPTGTVNPAGEGEASCAFAWGLTEAFGQEAPCAGPVPNGTSPADVHATLTGLEPDTAYVYHLHAKNHNGPNPGASTDNYRFTTPGPALGSASASRVSATGADLEAMIAPHEAPVEEHDLQAATKSPTTYSFQYSTQPTTACGAEPAACASTPSAPVSIGSPTEAVPVSRHLTALTAHTTYHYRPVVMSEALPASKPGVLVPFYGPDRTFTTQGSGGRIVLPDGRAWELVSPADKHGAPILSSGQAGADGSSFTFLTSAPTESDPHGAGEHGLQVLSSRVAPGVWSSVDINLSRSQPEGLVLSTFSEYRYFSEDLGVGVVESEGPFSIPEGSHQNESGEWKRIVESSPVPTERTPYLRHNATCATAPATCFEPLLDHQDVTSGEKYEGTPGDNVGAANLVAATPDASHVIVESQVQLTTGGPPVSSGSLGLYEWAAAKPPTERLSLVNVLESGALEPSRVVALSNDGSRVGFAACPKGSLVEPGEQGGFVPACNAFFVRDVLTNETAQLDLTETGGQPGAGNGVVQGASTDLSKVFFTDSARLTSASGASGDDLYACDFLPAVRPLKCALTDLTPVPAAGHPGAGEDAQVSHVLGMSTDGTYVYFVAKGVLAAGADPGQNVYLAHEHEGKWTITFIAPTAGLANVALESGCGEECVTAVSPDGQWLAFPSPKPLKGYDNRDAKTEVPDSEVYVYDAAADRLVCASCDPSGARPDGPSYVPASLHEQGSIFSSVNNTLVGSAASRSLFDSGRLFFDSGDALVPQDTNNNTDAYEYEPVGVGRCTPADPTFDLARGGCVGLISSGRAPGESRFLEASASASDVFFTTFEPLVGKDTDTALDVYDAHECSAASPCASETSTPEACASAGACRPAPVPQPSIFGQPSSATFVGPGNLTPTLGPPPKPKSVAQIRAEKLSRALASCRHRYKAQRTRRATCEKQAHKAYGAANKAKRAKKSDHADRKAGR